MSKVSRTCPICLDNFIVVMLDEGKQKAWPSCWKCGFEGHTPEDKEALTFAVNDLDKLTTWSEAIRTWEEYLALLEQENFNTEKEN